MDKSIDGATWRIEEFKALRAEIDRRSLAEQAIMGLQLAASAGVLSVAISHSTWMGALLALSPISMVLALAWFDQHLTIARIGTYIRDHIEIHAAVEDSWEAWFDRQVRQRRYDGFWRFLVANALLFFLPSAVALVWLAMRYRSGSNLQITLWSLDAAIVLIGAISLVVASRDRTF